MDWLGKRVVLGLLIADGHERGVDMVNVKDRTGLFTGAVSINPAGSSRVEL